MPRPWVIIHCISSVDGRLTTARGQRTRWEDLTPAALNEYYRLSRHLGAQGVLASASTLVVAEQAISGMDVEPGLPSEKPAPILIVPDNRGRINWTLLKRMPWLGRVLVICSEATPSPYLNYLKDEGIQWITAGADRVDMTTAMEVLWKEYRLGLLQCQGGSALNGALLRNGLVDEISLVIAPLAVGGVKTPTLFDAVDLHSVQEITRLRLSHCQGLDGGALWLRYEVLHPEDKNRPAPK